MTLNQKKQVQVAIGIIKNPKSRVVLLAWRAASKHQGDCYEFPGGKVDADETPRDALKRELLEEIGIVVTQSKKLTQRTYVYPEKTVVLHVFLVTEFTGEPHGIEGQEVRWVSVDTLPSLPFPEANVPLVRMARLEPTYHITHDVAAFLRSEVDVDITSATEKWLAFYIEKLPKHAQCHIRDKSLSETGYVGLVNALNEKRPDVQMIAMSKYKNNMTVLKQISGFHLSQSELMVCDQIDRYHQDIWYVAACHDHESIVKANELGMDAIVISPVKQTQSHPESQPLGWQRLFSLAQKANMPVFALGGMQPEDADTIIKTDVFGLAGIRGLLK